jgi:hypothetical protein
MDTPDVWPALLLVVRCDNDLTTEGADNIVAALERGNRVCAVSLEVSSSHLENFLAVMQVPFPELTDFVLCSHGTVPALLDSFVGGSAPRLRNLYFRGIPFPGLPKLLLSATHLVNLHLFDIPRSRYFTRGDAHCPFHVDRPRNTSAGI